MTLSRQNDIVKTSSKIILITPLRFDYDPLYDSAPVRWYDQRKKKE